MFTIPREKQGTVNTYNGMTITPLTCNQGFSKHQSQRVKILRQQHVETTPIQGTLMSMLHLVGLRSFRQSELLVFVMRVNSSFYNDTELIRVNYWSDGLYAVVLW